MKLFKFLTPKKYYEDCARGRNSVTTEDKKEKHE